MTVPVECKALVEPFEALVAAVASQVLSARRGSEAVDYAAVERKTQELTAALERATHACLLATLERGDKRVEINGELYVQVGSGKGTYRTMAGPIEIERVLYRKVGERNGKVVDAISLRVGVIGDGWLPQTAQSMAFLHQMATSREAERLAEKMGRLPYSRASFERGPHELGRLYLQHRADIEDQQMCAFEVPSEARSISVSLDRVSIPMEEPLKRPVGRPRKDAPKVRRVFHMAYCGTVTLHDGEGTALRVLRFGQMPGRDAQDLCNTMANAVFRLREKRPGLLLELLADGAPEMWNLLEASFPEEVFGKAHRLIDFWHLLEKLSPAAQAIFGKESQALMERWKAQLKRRKTAAAEILSQLTASGREELDLDSDSPRPVHEAITYLQNHADRMNYAGAIAKGLPIGSGNVEATCKTLVDIRMKRAGSRWKDETGEHVIKLRALALSDLWDGAMDLLMRTQRTAVRRVAA